MAAMFAARGSDGASRGEAAREAERRLSPGPAAAQSDVQALLTASVYGTAAVTELGARPTRQGGAGRDVGGHGEGEQGRSVSARGEAEMDTAAADRGIAGRVDTELGNRGGVEVEPIARAPWIRAGARLLPRAGLTPAELATARRHFLDLYPFGRSSASWAAPPTSPSCAMELVKIVHIVMGHGGPRPAAPTLDGEQGCGVGVRGEAEPGTALVAAQEPERRCSTTVNGGANG